LKFSDIPQFDQFGSYAVHIGWDYLPHQVVRHVLQLGLNLDPDFQREYVWTNEQKVRYVEYILRGGKYGRDLYFNCVNWQSGDLGEYVLVDGKQRLDAVLGWLSNEYPVFVGQFDGAEGWYRRDFTDHMRVCGPHFIWHVNDLSDRDAVLRQYVALNTGGTVHDQGEIDRVLALLGRPYQRPAAEEVQENARLGRAILTEAARKLRDEKLRAETRQTQTLAKPTQPKRRSKKEK
jgi:hypothetical protein